MSLSLSPQHDHLLVNSKEWKEDDKEKAQADKAGKLEQLEAAFQYFNDTSAQLADSYKLLEARVKQLTAELDEVNAEKRVAHQTKEQLESRMQALLDFLPGGVIVLDNQGYIVESNPAARELLNHSLDDTLWRQVIADCFAPRNDDGLEVSTKSGKRISIATSSMESDGQIILLTDQTETRELQRNLSRYERLSSMGKMVSALAHQIRTPLSAAVLYAGHLNDNSVPQPKKDIFSEKLQRRLQHMERTVRDMMLFVKSELPLNDEISMATLQAEIEDAMEVAVMTSSTNVTWLNPAPNISIRCHKEALVSAIMNLINNAIQSSEKEIALTISLSPGVGSVRGSEEQKTAVVNISIADDGNGMKSQELDSAQDLFMTTKAHGTGLGLAVVQSVSRAHGGQFSLQSEYGVGSIASISIPIHLLNLRPEVFNQERITSSFSTLNNSQTLGIAL